MSNIVPPAKGLNFLTWAQIEQLDARLLALAAQARESRCGMQIFLQLNENGMLTTCGQPMVMEKIRPGR